MTGTVDYGDHVEEFKYGVPTHHTTRAKHFEFCNQNFKRKHWHYYNFGNEIWFKRKKDLMWFKLRFGV